MKKIFTILVMLFLVSCSGSGNRSLEKNMAELDKIYGKCNNPNRQFSKIQKRICEDQQRAAGPDGVVGDPINISDVLSGISGNRKEYQPIANINKNLWDGSIKVLENYSIKNILFDAGYIETDWINDYEIKNQRCLIKVHITSPELISTGVNSKITCERKIDNQWYSDQKIYKEEEKQINLKILEYAKEFNLAQTR